MTAYGFLGRTIRLNNEDYDQWRKVFWAIPDLDAELFSLDTYYTETNVKNWFIRCSRALLKAHNKGLVNGSRDSDTERRQHGIAAAVARQMDSGGSSSGFQGDSPGGARSGTAGALRLVTDRDRAKAG